MEKTIAQRMKELADGILQLSADMARLSYSVLDNEDRDAIQALSDKLFHEQSEMRYEDYWTVQDIFNE